MDLRQFTPGLAGWTFIGFWTERVWLAEGELPGTEVSKVITHLMAEGRGLEGIGLFVKPDKNDQEHLYVATLVTAKLSTATKRCRCEDIFCRYRLDGPYDLHNLPKINSVSVRESHLQTPILLAARQIPTELAQAS